MTEKPVAKLVLRGVGEISDKEAYQLVDWLRDKVVDVLFQRKEFGEVGFTGLIGKACWAGAQADN